MNGTAVFDYKNVGALRGTKSFCIYYMFHLTSRAACDIKSIMSEPLIKNIGCTYPPIFSCFLSSGVRFRFWQNRHAAVWYNCSYIIQILYCEYIITFRVSPQSYSMVLEDVEVFLAAFSVNHWFEQLLAGTTPGVIIFFTNASFVDQSIPIFI